jgi:general secretion pathway protein J
MTGTRFPSERGFTLVEMLVALAIFALIAGAALGLLRGAVTSEAALRRHDATAGQVRRMLALWQADLGQAEPRLGFAANGGEGAPLVALVRDGWANPDGAPRPPLQRLDYRWTGQALVRRSASHVDGAAPDTTLVVLPLSTVPRLRLRDAAGQWHDGPWQGRACPLPPNWSCSPPALPALARGHPGGAAVTPVPAGHERARPCSAYCCWWRSWPCWPA